MNTKRIIGVGVLPAIPAHELKAGDRFMRDYGFIYAIKDLIPHESGKSITFIVLGETKFEKGRTLQKNLLRETLIVKLPAEEEARNER
jgi:hypothetical protein